MMAKKTRPLIGEETSGSSNPFQEKPPSVTPQQDSQDSSDSGESILAASVGLPIGTENPQTPRTNSATYEDRADRRDERRLKVEIIALGVGFIGLMGLGYTLYETRMATEAAIESAQIARRQMELSERPWIKVDIVLTRPFEMGRNVGIEAVVENVGHGVATEVSITAEVVLDDGPSTLTFPSRPSPIEIRGEYICGEVAHFSSSLQAGRIVLFPGQKEVIQTDATIYGDGIENKTIELSPWGEVFVRPVLFGCVTYRSDITQWRHVTGFAYAISSVFHPEGYVPLEGVIPVEGIRLKPFPYSKVANHID